jgi:hypothetical protein
MHKIKQGDERLYYDGKELFNVEVLSVRRKKDKPLGRDYKVDGAEYKLRILNENNKKRNHSDLEIIFWQPDRAGHNAKLW